jgi:hypothetical protein
MRGSGPESVHGFGEGVVVGQRGKAEAVRKRLQQFANGIPLRTVGGVATAGQYLVCKEHFVSRLAN